MTVFMQGADIQHSVKRNPFRPFAVRLNNGVRYEFKNARDVGAPKDYHMIIHFGDKEAVRIDTDSIVEIIEP